MKKTILSCLLFTSASLGFALESPSADTEKYADVAQAVMSYLKTENKIPTRLYTMVEKPGRGFWDHRLKRGQPGKDGITDREQAVFPSDMPPGILKNLQLGTQVPTWAPVPKNLSLLGLSEIMVGTPDSMVAYPTFLPKWKEEEIVGTCPIATDTEASLQRFGKGYAAVMYCGEWFSEWAPDGKRSKEAILERRPITAYWGRSFGKVEKITAVLAFMVRPETQLGKYYDWSQYKANGPYDYPLVFIVLNCDKTIPEILGFITPSGDPIKVKR